MSKALKFSSGNNSSQERTKINAVVLPCRLMQVSHSCPGSSVAWLSSTACFAFFLFTYYACSVSFTCCWCCYRIYSILSTPYFFFLGTWKYGDMHTGWGSTSHAHLQRRLHDGTLGHVGRALHVLHHWAGMRPFLCALFSLLLFQATEGYFKIINGPLKIVKTSEKTTAGYHQPSRTVFISTEHSNGKCSLPCHPPTQFFSFFYLVPCKWISGISNMFQPMYWA